MPYKRAGRRIPLRSLAKFETAMKNRDVNSAELARLVDTSLANVSNIRRGQVKSVRIDIAAALERALRVDKGELFDYDESKVVA